MQLTAKTLNEEKQKRYHEQDGKCLLCGNDLDPDFKKNHLDHDHALEGGNAGKVRGLLCIRCNPLEGTVKHKFERSGLKDRVDYINWLESLVNYLKQDYSACNIHPQFITDTCKKFGRLSLTEMQDEMKARNYAFLVTDKKADLVKKFKTEFRKGQKAL